MSMVENTCIDLRAASKNWKWLPASSHQKQKKPKKQKGNLSHKALAKLILSTTSRGLEADLSLYQCEPLAKDTNMVLDLVRTESQALPCKPSDPKKLWDNKFVFFEAIKLWWFLCFAENTIYHCVYERTKDKELPIIQCSIFLSTSLQ